MTSVGVMASSVVPSGGVILLEDCDNFTDAPWSTAGSVSVNAGGHTGNGYSVAAASGNICAYNIPAPFQTDMLTVGFWIKFSSMSGSATAFVDFRSDTGTTSHTSLRIYTSATGQIACYRTSPLVALGTPVVHGMSTGTWYYLETFVKLSDTAGQCIVRRDGAAIYTTLASVDTKSAGTKTVFDQIHIRGGTSTAFIVDEIYIRNDANWGPT